MRFSTSAGTAIVPTLARLVLCAVFVTAGWNKCFKQSEFTPEQARRLENLGVSVWPKVPTPEVTVRAGATGGVMLAAWHQDGEPAREEETTPPPAEASPPAGEPRKDEIRKATDTPPPATPPSAVEPTIPVHDVYESRAVHHVTLMVERQGWPYPVLLGWGAALTELFGGALLLVGLFSRVWGLGLAVTMAVAFYVTSLNSLLDGTVFSLGTEQGMTAFNTMFLQLSLFVMAFGILLTGPGPLSLDHRIFRRSHRSPIEYDNDPETPSLRPF